MVLRQNRRELLWSNRKSRCILVQWQIWYLKHNSLGLFLWQQKNTFYSCTLKYTDGLCQCNHLSCLPEKRTDDRSQIRNVKVLSKKVCERDLLICLTSKSSVYKMWRPVVCRITKGVHWRSWRLWKGKLEGTYFKETFTCLTRRRLQKCSNRKKTTKTRTV